MMSKVVRTPSHQSFSRVVLLLLVVPLLCLVGCPNPNPPPPPTKTLTIKTVQITSPETGKIYNATNDEDKASPGVQVTFKVELTTEGEGSFPTGVKAELSTNNKRIAPVDVKSKSITFEKYTLEEGTNSLQVKVILADGAVLNSNAVLLTADSQCYQINILSPKNGTLLGARDDENANKPDLQQTIIVQVDKAAVEPIKLTIRDAQGKETTIERKPFDGEAAFDDVTLPNGDVTLIASIEDGAGNKCEAQSKLTVRVDGPAVEITVPNPAQPLCPKDDKDPKAPNFQLEVVVKTSAEDKSEATLFLDERKLKTTVVSGGQAIFQIELSTLKEEFSNKLKASVTDTLGNTGESKEITVTGRSTGYNLQIVGLLDGQTIPPSRDLDPAKPGIQVKLDVLSSAPDGTEVTLTQDGNTSKLTLNGGKASTQLELKEGDNCLTLSTKEPTCGIETTTNKLCVIVRPLGVPTLSCEITEKMPPKFDATDFAPLNAAHDADDQTPGVQNTIRCQTDAEKDQNVEFDLNGTKQNKALVDGQGALREVIFDKLTFTEGINKVTIKVTNKLGKSETKTYTIDVDTTLPSPVTDLTGEIVDHRQSTAKLKWTAPGDGAKAVTGYEIRYSSLMTTITAAEWDKPEGKLSIKTTKKSGEADETIITNLSVAKTYVFAVRAIDAAGNLSDISNLVQLTFDFKTENISEPGLMDQTYGFRVAVVGDLDKDGIQDIAVTEPRWVDGAKTSAGAVHIYYGRNIQNGNYLAAKPDATISGEAASDFFGQSIVALGDLNGDGFADFAVSSFRTNGSKGRVYIIFGGQRNTSIKTDTVDKLAKVIISGSTASVFFGFNLAASGVGSPDFNGDQKADLVIAAPSETITGLTTKGKVYIFYSRSAYPTGTQPALVLSDTNADLIIENDNIASGSIGTASFGLSMICGDINQDGKADIAIGAPSGDTVVGFFGPIVATNKIAKTSGAQFVIDGKTTGGGSFGSALTLAGDVDKDSKPELIVSARAGQSTGRPIRSGQIFLFSGTKLISGAKLTSHTNADLIWTGQGTDTFLETVSPAGDINGDGFADFLIGEGTATGLNNAIGAGRVYLFFGQSKLSNIKSGIADQSADYIWRGSAAEQHLGLYTLIGGFDLTGDGKPDILIGESPTRGKSLTGKLFLYH